MKIEAIPLGHLGTNCYLITTLHSAIVIDPGEYSRHVEAFLSDSKEKDRLIIITHAHFDHICGAKELRDNTGVKIAISSVDNAALMDTKLSLSDKFHAHQVPFAADILLNDNQILKVGDVTFRCILTPGHTMGGMCYLTDKVIFSGDTLFLEAVGRTDFEGADSTELTKSANKLLELDENIVVYPGHGEPTTIGHEKMFNPFI